MDETRVNCAILLKLFIKIVHLLSFFMVYISKRIIFYREISLANYIKISFGRKKITEKDNKYFQPC